MKYSKITYDNLLGFLAFAILCSACQEGEKSKSIIVTNKLDRDRSYETLTLTPAFLQVEDLSSISLRNKTTNEKQVTQLIDVDGDKIYDELLFQPKVGANSSVTYIVEELSERAEVEELAYCYSRFVPERTDDYAWENDKVAFRMFGPTAQKMIEENVKGGTLTSGVDLWLKRVDYPIINKWYKKTTEGTGTYHEDTGEGLDNFHVGVSRGVGGLAVKKGDNYFVSKNFTAWETIATGPIRTIFKLDYADWDASGIVKESKTISLDFGSNMSKFSTRIVGADTVSLGLTLHEKDGTITANQENGWISYWEPHGDSELGTAIVTAPSKFIAAEEYFTKVKDLSHAYAHVRVDNDQVDYYAGFGWKKSGQFKSQQEWESYLNDFAVKLASPLEASIVH